MVHRESLRNCVKIKTGVDQDWIMEDKGQAYQCWWREYERRAPWRCGEDEGLRREYGGVSNEMKCMHCGTGGLKMMRMQLDGE